MAALAQAPKGMGVARRLVHTLKSTGFLPFLFVLTVVAGGLFSEYFFSARNFTNILMSATVVSVVAIGQFFVIVTAGIDLSVGAITALATVLVALALRGGVPEVAAVALVLSLSALVGLLNGVVVVFGGITPFIATLGMANIVTGLAFGIQRGQYIPIESEDFIAWFDGLVGPFPAEILILTFVTAIGTVVMRWTLFGRRLYALGGSLEAARLSGLPVDRDRIAAYVISGLLAGLAGLILAAQLRQGNNLLGSTLALGSIAAAVVGGASLFGGTGSPLAAVGGGLVIAMIGNILGLVSVPAAQQLIVTGALILVAVFFTTGRGGALKHGIAKAMRKGPPAGSRLAVED